MLSKTKLIRRTNPISIQKRNDFNLLTIGKIVTVGVFFVGSLYVFLQSLVQSKRQQKRSIIGRFHEPFRADAVPTSLKRNVKHTKIMEMRFLKKFIDSTPTGPLVILGPNGAGQSVLIKEVLEERKICFYLNLRMHGVTTGEELVHMLCEHLGYTFPVVTEMSQFLLRTPPRNRRVTHEEAEQGLKLITDQLQNHKLQGYPLGIPTICLDDAFPILGGQYSKQFLSDPYFAKFSDWCNCVYDLKLAHIIFVSSHPMSEIVLNSVPALKNRRCLVWINFPSTVGVNSFLIEEFDKIKSEYEEINKVCPFVIPSKLQIEWISKCIGGHIDDLDHAIVAIGRGESFTTVLQKMVTESIMFVERYMELLIKEASEKFDIEEKARVFEKYLRFWSMIRILSETQCINRRDLINEVFKDYVSELDNYAELEIICYLTRNPARQDDDFDKVDLQQTGEDDKTERFVLLSDEEGILEGWIVSAGSSRLRIAFNNIVTSPRIDVQRKRVEDFLILKKSLDKRKIMMEDQVSITTARKMFFAETVSVLSNSHNWINSFGDAEYKNRLQKLQDLEKESITKLSDIENELNTINQKIKLLEKSFE